MSELDYRKCDEVLRC